MKLHFGVIEQPYQDPNIARTYHAAMKKALGEGYGPVETTGDVAELLEAKYHPMEHFFQIHGQHVADAMADAMAGSLESVLMGAPKTHDPFGTAMSRTEERFKAMLSNKELETLGYPGVPTKAALQGRSKRHKRSKGPPRPSFIDSGLYQASFKAWVGE